MDVRLLTQRTELLSLHLFGLKNISKHCFKVCDYCDHSFSRISISKGARADSVTKCARNAWETLFFQTSCGPQYFQHTSQQRVFLFLIFPLNCWYFLRNSSLYEIPLIKILIFYYFGCFYANMLMKGYTLD